MNQRDCQIMLHALRLAIEYEESYIDANTFEVYRGAKLKQEIPKDFKDVVKHTRANIRQFKRLHAQIKRKGG